MIYLFCLIYLSTYVLGRLNAHICSTYIYTYIRPSLLFNNVVLFVTGHISVEPCLTVGNKPLPKKSTMRRMSNIERHDMRPTCRTNSPLPGFGYDRHVC
ncbi:hypothetical protein F5Y04DRAFT_243113, partial [Hypomontagnella monticulosa]